jgi:hypothetical protein
MNIIAHTDIQRFRTFEALLEAYRESMPREEARKRLTAWNLPVRREAALAWFDLRWPK